MAVGKGWEGVVLKLMRGKDFTFTVTGAEDLTENYRRVSFTDGGLLAAAGRRCTRRCGCCVWFARARASRTSGPTRSWTRIRQAGTFSFEFALHDGVASAWARDAKPGDTVEATVQGTGFTAPTPAPERLLVIGDSASLPAINSLLDTYPQTPATIWFETQHDSDERLPMRVEQGRHDIRRVRRGRHGPGRPGAGPNCPRWPGTRRRRTSGWRATR